MITRKEQQAHSVREYMRGGMKHVQFDDLSAALPERVRVFSVLTLIPGASIGYHVHENETELFYFGDSTATFSGHGHAVENTGDTNLVLLACIVKD